jgi:hypothetical protein
MYIGTQDIDDSETDLSNFIANDSEIIYEDQVVLLIFLYQEYTAKLFVAAITMNYLNRMLKV